MALTPALGLGCAPLGNLFSAIDDDQATATVDAAWSAGIRRFDTAPLYGHGLSEKRLGRALHHRPRDAYVLSTKVGRLLRHVPDGSWPSIFVDVPDVEPVFAYSRDDVLRSVEESLDRLGLDRLDIVHVHDPDDHEDEALAETFPALLELRDEGVVRQVGCGMNQWEMLARFVERVDLDVVLLAGRYTLLDRTGGDVLLPLCAARGVEVHLGGVFNSGLLADPDGSATYDYTAAPIDLVERVRTMRTVCERLGVRLPAAALQFALAHPAVTAVIIGARSPEEILADVADASVPIPPAVWDELGVDAPPA